MRRNDHRIEATRGDTAAAALYAGDVMHARLKPMGHRFSYRVLNLLIDLDRLEEADRQSKLFGVNRRALYSFHEIDHGPRDGCSLRKHIHRLAAAQGIDLTGGRVQLLCYPRLFGYVFNPLSVYFCTQANGGIALMIYEVRNTFGEMHTYVLPVADAERRAPVIRQEQSKQFYVSPFIGPAMRYLFRVSPPSATVKIRILELDSDGPLLAATYSGRKQPLTTRMLLRAFVLLPVVTVKIIAAIHWQALRLWLKGAKIVARSPQDAAGAGTRPDGSKPGLSAVPN